MPRRSKSARLWLRPEATKNGKLYRRATWLIIDGGRHFSTGCLAHEIENAERKLAEHVGRKYQPSRKERDIELIDVADVLTIYLDDTGPRQASRAKFEARIGRLNDYWGGKMLAEVTGETCRDYVRRRGTGGGAAGILGPARGHRAPRQGRPASRAGACHPAAERCPARPLADPR